MADDVLVNKVSMIENCLQRIAEEYQGNPQVLKTDYTKQDSIILNLQRACEASIDIAMRLVRKYKLGVPQESREAFQMLSKHGYLDEELSKKLQAMVGFRNIAIHDYQGLNLDILESILKKDLGDFKKFSTIALEQAK